MKLHILVGINKYKHKFEKGQEYHLAFRNRMRVMRIVRKNLK